MKLYIAGPMQGIPNFNFPLFNRVQEVLETAGHSCFNPAKRDIERHGGVDISADNATGDHKEAAAKHGFNLGEALRDDTNFICMEADGIVMLPGWEQSAGALAEWTLARALKKKFFYWHDALLELLQ